MIRILQLKLPVLHTEKELEFFILCASGRRN